MAERQEWPKMMYGPGGEQRVFNEGDKIPSGFKDHPSKVKGAGDDPQTGDTDQVRALKEENAELRSRLARLESGNTDEVRDVTNPDAAAAQQQRRQTGSQSPVRRAEAMQDDAERQKEEERFRTEGLEVLRQAGVDMPSDATAAQVDEALKKLGK